MNTTKLISSSYNPKKDKPIICNKCGKGIIQPFNPESDINHYFECDVCGRKIHIDPIVIVE